MFISLNVDPQTHEAEIEAVDALRAELEARGVSVKDGRWGYRLLVVEDLDGNQLFFPYPNEPRTKIEGLSPWRRRNDVLRPNSLEVEPRRIRQTEDADQLPSRVSQRVQFVFGYRVLNDHLVFPSLLFVHIDHRRLTVLELRPLRLWCGVLWWICQLNLHGGPLSNNGLLLGCFSLELLSNVQIS
jgi:hypothetical protein